MLSPVQGMKTEWEANNSDTVKLLLKKKINILFTCSLSCGGGMWLPCCRGAWGWHVLLQECKSEDNLLGQLEFLQIKTFIVLVNGRA